MTKYKIEIYLDGNWQMLLIHCCQNVSEAKEFCNRALMNFKTMARVVEIDGDISRIVFTKRYNPRNDPDFYGDYEDWEDENIEDGISWKEAGF